MRTTTRRTLTALALASLVLGAGSATAAPAKLGPNLVSNPGFEKAAAEAPGQPVLPADWSVEGVSVFEYKADLFKEGARAVTLSGTLGGKQICDGSSGKQTCTPNPATAATDPLPLRAAWVTKAPIAVEAGKKYRFSSWILPRSLNPDDGVPGEGAATRVRWLGAGGAILATAEGPKLVKGPKRTIGWKLMSTDLVAPAGSTGAQLLLGYTDFTTTALQHGYDVVSFALVK
jgi:hypothetical protein